MSQLEDELLDEVHSRLDRWQVEYRGQPDKEREQLWLFALEREQIVAIAYREEAVAGRVDELDIGDELRSLVRQTLVWIWKDEELHAEYMRGALLQRGGVFPSLVVYGRQVQGALSGWVAATEHNVRPGAARLRTGAAGMFVMAGSMLGRIPSALRKELRYQTFHRYCELNVALEASAELAYCRLIDLAANDEERVTFSRIREDEARHGRAFRLLASMIGDDDRLVDEQPAHMLVEAFSTISPWFVPAALRPRSADGDRPRTFGTGARVVVRTGTADGDKARLLDECLDRAGLGDRTAQARSAAIRASFMLGYARRDRSNVNDPELLYLLAAYLRRHGVEDVAVLEAPTVYGNSFAHRSVGEVAAYFGYDSSAYRVVDVGDDLRPCEFERGFVQRAISGTWLDADLRIVMPKLRTDPTEFAHSSLSTLEGMTGGIAESFYANRRTDFRSATMMLLDVAPPDFAVVDGWAPVADGPFGVMGCHRPAAVRHVYAGADALAVDEVVLGDLGISDPRRAPIVGRAHHWFGLPVTTAPVDGDRPALGRELRGAHASRTLRALGTASYPVYMYLSNEGDLFVPQMDEQAFPPLAQPPRPVRIIRRAAQLAFGIRPPK